MLYILLSPCVGPVHLQYVATVLLISKFEHIVTKLVKFSTQQYPRPLQTLAHLHALKWINIQQMWIDTERRDRKY